ncbi:MAG TPA: hypothetical protein VGK67_24620 [Myxococcales bacterium]
MADLRRQRALESCKRLLVAMGAWRATDEFDVENVWAVIPGLASRNRAQLDLPVSAAQLLPELAVGMGLAPGASTRTIASAFLTNFGDYPGTQEELLEASDYVRTQANGGFGLMTSKKPKGPNLGF